jgi:hypothetical protein
MPYRSPTLPCANQQTARPTLLRTAGEPSRQPTNKAPDRPGTVAAGIRHLSAACLVSPVVAAVGLPRRWGAGLVWSRRWPGLFPAGSTRVAAGRPNHSCLATTRTPTPSRSGPSARAVSQGQNASQTNARRLTPSAPGRPRHHPCYLVSSLQNSRLCAPSLISSEWPLTSHNGGSECLREPGAGDCLWSPRLTAWRAMVRRRCLAGPLSYRCARAVVDTWHGRLPGAGPC